MTQNTAKFSLIGLLVCITTIIVLAIIGLPGCSFLKEHSTEISTKLEEKVDNGGADKVEQEINKLVADGKLTEWQADKVKEFIQDGYEKLQERLKELSKEQEQELTEVPPAE